MLRRSSKTLIASTLAAVALTINMPIASFAHDFEPISSEPSATGLISYNIDDSRQPVAVAWKAAEPRVILIAVHGFGLHKYAFKQFAERLQKDGISTYSLDVRGFGGWMRSQQGSQINFPETMQDLQTLLHAVRKEAPGTPIFLMGESMGGAIALSFAAQNPALVDGVISSVPSDKRFRKLRTIGRIALTYLFSGNGKINLNNILVNNVTKNGSLRESWETDRQAKLDVSLRELLRLNTFMKESRREARLIDKLPVLVVQGDRDNLVKPKGTEQLFDSLSTKDKQLLVLKQGEHLTFEEGQFDQPTLDRVEHWMTAHAPEKQPLLALNSIPYLP